MLLVVGCDPRKAVDAGLVNQSPRDASISTDTAGVNPSRASCTSLPDGSLGWPPFGLNQKRYLRPESSSEYCLPRAGQLG